MAVLLHELYAPIVTDIEGPVGTTATSNGVPEDSYRTNAYSSLGATSHLGERQIDGIGAASPTSSLRYPLKKPNRKRLLLEPERNDSEGSTG